jgi:hypothetical protein
MTRSFRALLVFCTREGKGQYNFVRLVPGITEYVTLTRYQECRDLVEDLLHAELLFGGEVLVHVRLDEQTEQVLVLALLECRPPAGGFLLENGLLLLAHELETDAAHRLLRFGDYPGFLVHLLFWHRGRTQRVTGLVEWIIKRRKGETYDCTQDRDPPFEDVDELHALRTVENLRKGKPELIGVLSKLEGVEGVVEPGETDDVERRAGEP